MRMKMSIIYRTLLPSTDNDENIFFFFFLQTYVIIKKMFLIQNILFKLLKRLKITKIPDNVQMIVGSKQFRVEDVPLTDGIYLPLISR